MTLMTQSHEALKFCRDQKDYGYNRWYGEIRDQLKSFTNTNTRSDKHKVSADFDERLRLRLRSTPEFCHSHSYRLLKEFASHLDEAAITRLRQRLETPSDPVKGDCP